MALAKISGIMPAILTISGRVALNRHGHAIANPAAWDTSPAHYGGLAEQIQWQK